MIVSTRSVSCLSNFGRTNSVLSPRISLAESNVGVELQLRFVQLIIRCCSRSFQPDYRRQKHTRKSLTNCELERVPAALSGQGDSVKLFPHSTALHKNTAFYPDCTNFMKEITPESVRQFLLVKYLERIQSLGLASAELPDDFDLLLSGVIDSFGILEMISTIEEEFQIELDLAALDAEQITIVGPLSRFVASNAKTR